VTLGRLFVEEGGEERPAKYTIRKKKGGPRGVGKKTKTRPSQLWGVKWVGLNTGGET